ncbi:hypothetical protein GWR56_10915 [Mucilaginibacter sp. 14171R-50]|uniref:hypothetical protein n=1 Tax=Mucilaginibacter sp. 14171R-50 TaxID=2703789 RepID=UPI00138CE145|nr:hypothetical protein [Mucilaginibacter sp. 14171R-50]QHS56020.1 hypothetical protein GWR56_10915 [Mucilaginibacter sp. 14171R-50]
MLDLVKPQYITDENGKKISVILPVSEYERLIQELEDAEDVKLYDEVKNLHEPSTSFDEYVKKRRAK